MSPIAVLLKIAAIVFAIEAAIMLVVFVFFDVEHVLVEAVIDLIILMGISTPLIYLWVIKPSVVAREQAEAELRRIASHDPLTGLPNRALLHDRMEMALGRARRSGAMVAILFADLDGFKRVNDDLGHEAGDRILETIGERFSRCVRETDTISRYGGDEFVVLLPDLVDSSPATAVADKLIAALAAPFDDKRVPEIGASVGIALYPADGEDPDRLLVAADRAMYAAKRDGPNKWRFAARKRTTATA